MLCLRTDSCHDRDMKIVRRSDLLHIWILFLTSVTEDTFRFVTENYDGRDLPLGGSDGRVLSVSMFPHLKDLKGRTLITSNGDTILGADDKAELQRS